MKLRYFTAMGAAALAIGMPAAASAAPAGPVLLAMATFATETGGTDAHEKASLKKAHYMSHAKAHADGDCNDCADCPDCADCADCDKAKSVVTAAEEAAGICNPTEHGAAKKAKAGA